MRHSCARVLGLFAAAFLCGQAVPSAATSDPFDDFISPVSNPVNFEDPRIGSDVRPLYVYHDISSDFLDTVKAVGLRPPKGDAQVVAVQIRIKLLDRLGFIASKDGYVWVDPDNRIDDIVQDGHGFDNLGLGLKYAFVKDLELPFLLTGGLRYEAPSGEPQGLQGSVFRTHNALGVDLHERGDGILNPFLSAAWGYENLHVLGYTGPRIALDGVDSSFYDTSIHADYKLGSLYPLIEINWIHVLDGGNRLQPLQDAGLEMDQEGFDFFNLGAPEAGGTDVATIAFGGRWRILEDLDTPIGSGGIDFGAVAEFPMTSRHDIFGWRVTTDFIFWAR